MPLQLGLGLAAAVVRGERFRVAPGAPGYNFPNADVALDNNNTLVPNNKRLNDSVVANVYTSSTRPAAPTIYEAIRGCSRRRSATRKTPWATAH